MSVVELRFAGVSGQWSALRAGEVTSVELTRAYLAWITERDPALNAFRLVFGEEALRAAAQADARRALGEDGPLLGVPVAVKEDVDLAGLPTTMGTDAVDRVAPADAEMITRLRRAGVVILGRTRAPELCLWPFTETEHAGPTRNPWSPAHSPAGSSGGAAAAVAAGLAAAAVGSDGGGSIRLPAAATGLFGLKPQRGRVSLAPHPQVWTGLSVFGPITRTVADAALLLDAIHGPMPGDAAGARAPASTFAQAARSAPGRLRVGVSLRPWALGVTVDPQVRDALYGTVRLLVGLGHTVVRADPPRADPAALFSFAPRYVRSAADAAAVLDRPERLSATTRGVVSYGRRYSPGLLAAAVRYSERVARRTNRVFDDVDVVLSPVTSRPPLRIGQFADRGWLGTLLGAQAYAAFTPLWNLAGNPAASVPAGFTRDGLPLAVQVVGAPHDECTVLSLAAQLESARPWAHLTPPLI